MSRISAPFLCLLVLATACGGVLGDAAAPAQPPSRQAGGQSGNRPAPARPASRMVEGKDYVVLERVRFNDEEGFDRPVEAISILVPRGWRTEGGIRWNDPAFNIAWPIEPVVVSGKDQAHPDFAETLVKVVS